MSNQPAAKYRTLSLLAPVSGNTMTLSETIDPLIYQGLLGHGLAIEPVSSRVVAPCRGKITDITATGHQLTICNEHGVIITIIIGYDGLKTHGLGYIKKVNIGDSIVPGQILVELDTLKLKASLTSLIVSVLISKGAVKLIPLPGSKRAGEDELLKIVIKEPVKDKE